jgi:hypothetical protein
MHAVLARRNERLERAIERLLLDDPTLLEAEMDLDAGIADAAADATSALAAVARLTTLFADIEVSSIETHLSDPLLALENIDLDLQPQ